MVDTDWGSVRVPILMAEVIDRWLELDIAKKNGIFSRTDFVTHIVREWFIGFEKDFGIFLPKEMRKELKDFDASKARLCDA